MVVRAPEPVCVEVATRSNNKHANFSRIVYQSRNPCEACSVAICEPRREVGVCTVASRLSLLSERSNVNMPFAKKSGSKAKATNASSVVLKYRYFGKASLATYPHEDGVPCYVPKNQDEKQFFAKGSIMDSRDKTNCELFHRLGMGVCLCGEFAEPWVSVRGEAHAQ